VTIKVLLSWCLFQNFYVVHYYKECTIQEKDRDSCPKIVNLGSPKTDLFYESKKYGFKKRWSVVVPFLSPIKLLQLPEKTSTTASRKGEGHPQDCLLVHCPDLFLPSPRQVGMEEDSSESTLADCKIYWLVHGNNIFQSSVWEIDYEATPSEKCVLAAALMAVILDDLKYGREPSEQ
jgi:hypothetical protein